MNMKTSLIVPATLALVVGVVGLSQASPAERAGSATTQTTKAPAPRRAVNDPHVPSQLKSGKRLGAHQLKSLGLKPLAGNKLAAVKKLNTRAVAATVGNTYAYTWKDGGHTWVDVYHSRDDYDTNFYFIYYYNNYKICTTSGTNCLAANAYTYSYYLNYYGNWYYYGEFGPERG
jgi:hypothetical protein